jgi:hypothetical protein
MIRQVLPARRRWLTPGTVALIAILAGCAVGAIIPVPVTPSPGVAPSVWTIRFDGDCDSIWQQPATFCRAGSLTLVDSCHWECVGQ